MATKKLVRKVQILVSGGVYVFVQFEVGKQDVVSIVLDRFGVYVYFRAEEEKIENSTPLKMEERPMKYFSGLAYIVEDVLE